MSEPASSTPAPAQDRPAGWVHVAEMKDLARRKRKQVSVAGCPIALFLVDGDVYAVDEEEGDRAAGHGDLLALAPGELLHLGDVHPAGGTVLGGDGG